MKKKKKSRGQLVKELDSVYSKYIRLKDAVGGDATCVTCGVSRPWKELQNGHFYTRGRFPTRWDDDNCHVQCYRCNVLLKGNYILYTRYMINRYGMEFVEELETRSLSVDKISTAKIQEMIEEYGTRIVEILSGDFTPDTTLDKTPWGVL